MLPFCTCCFGLLRAICGEHLKECSQFEIETYMLFKGSVQLELAVKCRFQLALLCGMLYRQTCVANFEDYYISGTPLALVHLNLGLAVAVVSWCMHVLLHGTYTSADENTTPALLVTAICCIEGSRLGITQSIVIDYVRDLV